MSKEIHTRRGMAIVVDDDLYDSFAKMGKWTALKAGRKFYAQRWIGNKLTFMHRIIMPNAKIIDHINGNGLDNRRKNLRAVTNSQNMLNPNNLTPTNNTSGKRGVFYDKYKCKWIAAVRIRNKLKYLGRFNEYDNAVLAREAFDKKLADPAFLEAL